MLELQRYNTRHDSVLEVIADFVRDHLPESFEMSADLPDLYNFPLVITPLTCNQTLYYRVRLCDQPPW